MLFFSELCPWPAESKSVYIFEISLPVPEILKKSLFFSNSAFYSVHTLFKTMQLFSTSLAIKIDPDEIETFCFFFLKAEIHAILAQKL
jgi:hypothetical protein